MRYLFLILSFTLISSSAFSQEKDSIYTVVQEMPRFPGCEDMEGTAVEKKKCAEKKMLEYMYKNIRYPSLTENNIGLYSQMVVLEFIIEKDGCWRDMKVLRGPAKVVNDVYIKSFSEMPCWISGKQNGKPVAVRFRIPIRVNLRLD